MISKETIKIPLTEIFEKIDRPFITYNELIHYNMFGTLSNYHDFIHNPCGNMFGFGNPLSVEADNYAMIFEVKNESPELKSRVEKVNSDLMEYARVFE